MRLGDCDSHGHILGVVSCGHRHPAVDFLLLLAVADDAIGMIIIAVAYPDPDNLPEPQWLVLVLIGMFIAFLMRKYHFHMKEVTRRNSHQSWVQYIVIPGFLSWLGFLWAHLHPALALVPIIPFMPAQEVDIEALDMASTEEEKTTKQTRRAE